MEVEQAQDYFRCVETDWRGTNSVTTVGKSRFPVASPCLTLREPAQVQDVEHQVTSIDILHDEEEMVGGLEAGVEASEEWRLSL